MEAQSTKVITGKVRFCYCNVFEPTAMQEGQDKKYNIAILIDKTDTVTLGKVTAAIEAAKIASGDKLKDKTGKYPANLKLPLRDGDVDRSDDEAFAGKMFINANSLRKPQIVDAELNEIMSKDEFYAGCYGRASINFYAFNVAGSKGIAAGLNNLQKTEEGERLAGGTSAADDFSDDIL